MIDFDDVTSVLNALKDVQGAEKDMREAVREAVHFITKRDGQWEPRVWNAMEGRFRGTFDMCTPIIDSTAGEMAQSDFAFKVSPASGEANEKTAETINGLLRNIRNLSNFEHQAEKANRMNITGGFDAFEVVQEYAGGKSFDQDLLVKRIPNAVDNVWYDSGSVNQDGSDMGWSVVMTAITKEEYSKRYPKGSGMSVGDDRNSETYWQKAEKINVGRILYKRPTDIDMVLMSDGSVYDAEDEKYLQIKDDLAAQGITVIKERTRKSFKAYSRMFDGSVWLNKEQETVFDAVPIIPIYGNFDIVESKRIYFGEVEKLYDQQRSLNYAVSRDIEDGALAPSPAVWMTKEMGVGQDYSQMNKDRKAVRFFNIEPQNTGLTPQYTGGPQSSPGLQTTIMNMKEMIASSSNFFGAQMGNAAGMQSGIAGSQQIDQGNLTSTKWFEAAKVAYCQIAKVLVRAMPKVYDSTQQKRVMNEDGTTQMVTLNDQIIDAQTQTMVEVNDLSSGEYGVVCEVGPAFNNQQKETVQSFLDMAAIDPTIIERGKDIWLKNQKTPGMDQMAERAREDLLNAGMIPEAQLTDKERQKIQQAQAAAANQPPQEDPMMVAARAEEGKAQAELMSAQNKQAEIQGSQQIKLQELQLQRMQQQLEVDKFLREKNDKYNVDAANIQQSQQKIDLQAQQQQFNAMMQMQQQQQQQLTDAINNLKSLKDAIGADTIMAPAAINAYSEQAQIVNEEQSQ